jgi:sec-independent protein translocase protein TatA
MGPLGVPEIIFIFVFALLIFGPKKLPQLGKTFGKSIAEFRRASDDLRSTFKREMDSIERETEQVKEVTQEVKKDLDTSNYYDDSEDDYYSDYDQTPAADKSSSNTASASASPDTATDTATASTNGTDAMASAASNDAMPPDEVPSTVEKSMDATDVKAT